jgi:transposase
VVVPYGRKTIRLVELLTAIGVALGGEAGQRMSHQVGCSTSGDALLHQIRATPSPAFVTPRVLGVGDFSFLRGQVFGTILVDLERHKSIDLLSDREAETLAAWLRPHPGVKITSRDRGGAYAEGARLGAPDVLQVADRFHLLVNLSKALEGFFLHKRAALKAAVNDPTEAAPQTESLPPVRLSQTGKTQRQEAVSLQLHQHRVERYYRVHELHQQQADIADIARQVGMGRRSVYRYLQIDDPPERMRIRNRTPRPKKVVPYQDYLLTRWNAGCRNARRLWREIADQGYTASYSSVECFLSRFRTQEHKFKQEALPADQ